MIETSGFVDESTSRASEGFLKLIRRVTASMSKEQRQVGRLRIDGKLVHVPPSDIIVVGDLHGDLESLTYILEDSRFLKRAQESESVCLVFLGDYGDRGEHSPEVYPVVLRLKESFPDKVILMRGNHEGPEDLLPTPHDLPLRLKQKYGTEAGAETYAELRKLFNQLHNAVLVDGQIVLIHGGAASKASSLEDLAYANRTHPREPHLEEMLWSDPADGLVGTKPSPRGAGKLFGKDITERLLQMLGAKALIRGHESCQAGFKTNHDGKVLTVFSTNKLPYGNRYGAYLQLDLTQDIRDLSQLEQHIKRFKRKRP